MNVFDYLQGYKNVSFKEKSFNEVDALLLAMIGYVPFDELKFDKKRANTKEVLSLIENYGVPYGISQRKFNYIRVLKEFCSSLRYKNAMFAFFKKERDSSTDKQFQAITIILNKTLFISFCGTDSTTLGWKEDFNMAYLEIVPSEIEASKYANFICKKIWFKKIYLIGHSKGGRLAVSAAKDLKNKKRLLGIYSFDAPNFPANCYNEQYKSIDHLINAYAPNESIIGRLMIERRKKKIVTSTNKLLMQHDLFSWIINDSSFVYTKNYDEKSTRIVKSINHALQSYNEETKRLFVDTLFDILDRLDIEKLPNEKDLIAFFAFRLPSVRQEWKNTPKENREVVKKIIFDIIKDYLFGD